MTVVCQDPLTWSMRIGTEEPIGIAWYKSDGTLRDFTTGGPYDWTVSIAKSEDGVELLNFTNSVAVQLVSPNVTVQFPDGSLDNLDTDTPYNVQVTVHDGGINADRGMRSFILLLTPAHS